MALSTYLFFFTQNFDLQSRALLMNALIDLLIIQVNEDLMHFCTFGADLNF